MKKKNTIRGLILCFMLLAGILAVNSTAVDAAEPVKEISEAGQQTRETDTTGTGGILNFANRRITVENDQASQEAMRRSGASGAAAAKYDPRTLSGNAAVSIKDQGSTGLCWAFSATTAAEREYLGQTGLYQQLSPAHLGYFLYNRVNDPLGNTAGDRNVITASGENYKTVGGNNMMAFQAMANWTGLALETTAPFNNGSPAASFSSSLAYKNAVTLERAELLDSVSSVKEAILENGSVMADFCWYGNGEASPYYNRTKTAYYCPESLNSNHAVTIVGWDDTYSKSNFAAAYRPSGNGAWIAQNSWGGDFGEDGYFYISYEDGTIADAMTIDVQSAATYQYNYQYDGNANLTSVGFSAGERAANVYQVPSGSGHLLKAVGFTTWNQNTTNYNVEVYSDVKSTANPTDGVKECSFAVSTDHAGFYTFSLPSALYLKSGTKYAIVLTTKSYTNLGVEASKSYSWVSFVGTFAKNQSFWCAANSSSWNDLYASNCCARIKGFATTVPQTVATSSISIEGKDASGQITATYGSTKYLKVRFKPTNATQRNLTWTSSNPKVATVSANGKVNMYAVGKTTITATATGGKKASVVLNITAPKIAAPARTATKLYGYDDVRFSWSKSSGATGYYVYYRKSNWKSWKYLGYTTKTYFKKANLADGAKYYFRVYPYVKIAGKAHKSTSYKTGAGIYTLKKLPRPSVSRSSKNYVKVKWTNIPGESGYQIARSKYKTRGFKVVKTRNYKYKAVTIKTARYQTYYYKVRAYKIVNGKRIYGPWSAVRAYRLR